MLGLIQRNNKISFKTGVDQKRRAMRWLLIDRLPGKQVAAGIYPHIPPLMLPTVALGVKPSPFWPQQSTGPNAKLYPFWVPACPG
jgi:hypothetical protein